MLHFVTSYMTQNKSRKQTLESAQCGLEISFNPRPVVNLLKILVIEYIILFSYKWPHTHTHSNLLGVESN